MRTCTIQPRQLCHVVAAVMDLTWMLAKEPDETAHGVNGACLSVCARSAWTKSAYRPLPE